MSNYKNYKLNSNLGGFLNCHDVFVYGCEYIVELEDQRVNYKVRKLISRGDRTFNLNLAKLLKEYQLDLSYDEDC